MKCITGGLLSCLIVGCLGVAWAQPHGIETRAPNTTLLIGDLPPESPSAMMIQRVFPRLSFSRALLMLEAPDDSGRLYVVQRNGQILVFPNIPDPAPEQVDVFLNIGPRVRDSNEQGLLGLAFDPDYATSGVFYVYYSWNRAPQNCDTCPTRVSRFVNPDPAENQADPNSETVIIEITQPFANHNGGMIAFGPDEMLYVAVGDGGSGGDPQDNAQNTTNLLGNLLRLDVRGTPDPGLAYRIPPDNPFFDDAAAPAGAATRKEIYAYGLRNPWRFSFDPLSHTLFLADVGQSAREEVNAIESGGNYGWRCREGKLDYNMTDCPPREEMIDPLIDYGRAEGQSITGGFVYHGDRLEALYGMYLYGDYLSSRIWGLRWDGEEVTGPHVLVTSTGFNIAGFGQGNDGEVYVLDFAVGGGVYTLLPVVHPPSGDFPLRLSDLPALYAAGLGQDQTDDGILPYDVQVPFWRDGVRVERFLALPGLEQAAYHESEGWTLPNGTVVVKNYLLPLDARDHEGTLLRIETRLLLRHQDAWHGFSYAWDADGADARLLPDGGQRVVTRIDDQGAPYAFTWRYLGRGQCLECRGDGGQGLPEISTAQLNRPFAYPGTGVTDNQLRTLEHIGLLDTPLPAAPNDLPRLAPLGGPDTLQERARSYLDVNCAMCHRPSGPAPGDLDLRRLVANSAMNALDVAPRFGDLNLPDARIIAPGAPARSVLHARMNRRDAPGTMPPHGSSAIDAEAVAAIETWVRELGIGATWELY